MTIRCHRRTRLRLESRTRSSDKSLPRAWLWWTPSIGRRLTAEIRKRCLRRLAADKVPVKIRIVDGGLIGERQRRII